MSDGSHAPESFDARVHRIARIRDKQVASTTYYTRDESFTGNVIGVYGEAEFERIWGEPIDEERRPFGDGGIDFQFHILGVPVTIDIKTYNIPNHLLVEAIHINRMADILILAEFFPDPTPEYPTRGHAELIGWDHSSLMRFSTPRKFSKNQEGLSYSRHRDHLHAMWHLTDLMNKRTDKNGNLIRAITPSRRPLRDGKTQAV